MELSAPTAVEYGQHSIRYQLSFRPRRTLTLSVRPDQSVHVSAPLGTDPLLIQSRVLRRAPWILRQQAFFASFEPRTTARQYISGETHLYLGRQYRLKLEPGAHPEVKLWRGRLLVRCPHPDAPAEVAAALAAWYRQRAAEQVALAFERVWPRFAEFGLARPTMQVRHMRTRWGSCHPAGRLTLNADLVRAPKGCLDYVLMHELCHLVVPNHSARFYALQGRLLPDWRTWKTRLEELLS